MTVPYSFGSATSAIPLSQLDSNFNTPITLGNTAIQLGNTVTTLNNMTLANVTVSSGTISLTDITASGNVTLSGGTANGVAYLNGSKVLTTGSALVFDGTNLGVGVTPSAWSSFTGLQVGPSGSVSNSGTGTPVSAFSNNAYYNGTSWVYINTAAAAQYQLSTSQHIWRYAASGSGNITWSEAMRLDSSGNLGIGTSSPAAKLDVSGTARANTLFFNYNTGFYANDGYISNYSAANYLYVNGNTAGGLALRSEGGGNTALWLDGSTNANGSIMRFNTASAERMRLDSSGNLGLGVTPSAWGSSKAIQLGSAASIFAVGSNSYIGANSYYNGTDNKYISNGYATLYSQQSDGAHKFYTAASGTAGTTATFTQAMTLDASGRLLVGGTSASLSANQLEVQTTSGGIGFSTYSASESAERSSYSAYAGFQIAAYQSVSGSPYTKNVDLVSNADGTVPSTMRFWTKSSGASSPTERARIDSSGNLLVGTTPSTASALGGGRLVLTSDGTNFAGTFYQSSTSSSVYTMRVRHDNTTSGAYIQFVTDSNVETGRIYDSAGTMQYASSSDARLKTNVQPMQNSLQSVLALNPCTFDMRRGEDTFIPSAGLIAQEVHEVYPYVVGVGGDDENTNPWSVDYGKLTPLLVAAIKEQQALIQTLTERITALEGAK